MTNDEIATELHKLGKRENSLLTLLEAEGLTGTAAELVGKLRLVQTKRCDFLVEVANVNSAALDPTTFNDVVAPKDD